VRDTKRSGTRDAVAGCHVSQPAAVVAPTHRMDSDAVIENDPGTAVRGKFASRASVEVYTREGLMAGRLRDLEGLIAICDVAVYGRPSVFAGEVEDNVPDRSAAIRDVTAHPAGVGVADHVHEERMRLRHGVRSRHRRVYD